MKTPQPMTLVKLFISNLNSKWSVDVKQHLIDAFGPTNRRSEQLHFKETTCCYRKMKNPINLTSFSFEDWIEADKPTSITLHTFQMEHSYRKPHHEVSGPVNLDSGYIGQLKVILASTKNFYHRIYTS